MSLREDWEEVKFAIMEEIVKAKFTQNPKLKQLLLETGNKELQERRSRFPDKTWGMNGKGEGKNMIGKILMKVGFEFYIQLSL